LSNDTPRPPDSGPDPGRPGSSSGSANEPVYPPAYAAPAFSETPSPYTYEFIPRQRFQHTWWKHILLFLLTAGSTWLVIGPWYSVGVLAILGAHEMGHYIACRYYRVDATLPYFIPMPIVLSGTLGAVIRIREPFPNRKALFDIGIAGPIAGFVVLVPALFIGMAWSRVIEVVPVPLILGRPLLYQFARWMTFGSIPPTHFVELHPLVLAAWFGMLATALNLLPFGQLDGGHILYALLRRIATPLSLLTVGAAVIMTFFSLNWLLMTVLMVAMLYMTGPRHPPTLDETDRLGWRRYALGVLALVILILCFTPFPIRILVP
jgi:membrane-associated protease RseP (regulator of RpoE activity)